MIDIQVHNKTLRQVIQINIQCDLLMKELNSYNNAEEMEHKRAALSSKLVRLHTYCKTNKCHKNVQGFLICARKKLKLLKLIIKNRMQFMPKMSV